MPTLLTVGGLFGPQNLDDGQVYDTLPATAYVGGTVNVTNDTTLNLDPIVAIGAATTFNISDNGTVNYDPAIGISALNTFNVGTGGTLSLSENVTATALDTINFSGTGGTLVVPESLITANILSSVTGFGVNDTLQIENSTDVIASAEYSGGALHFLDAGGNEVGSMAMTLDGDVDPGAFSVTDLGGGNFAIVACHLRGTRIRTAQGDVAIEDLKIGDRVMTESGALRAIKWIGCRSYSSVFAAKNPSVQPVVIARGAIADAVPAHDLYVSPNHAMYIDGVLVEARQLLNGRTIRPAPMAATVEYFNIEFDTHDVIFAEGAPSETFLDRECREMFQNAHEYAALYPEDAPAEPVFYADRVEDGPILADIRLRLDARAGCAEAAPAGQLEGTIDHADWACVKGWAFDAANPSRPVVLELFVDNQSIGQIVANRHRADLERAGFGNGRCAFDVALPHALDPHVTHVIELRQAGEGRSLPRSPVVLDALPQTEAGAATMHEAAVNLGGDVEQLDRALTYLLHSMDRVVQAKAAKESHAVTRFTRFSARSRMTITRKQANAA